MQETVKQTEFDDTKMIAMCNRLTTGLIRGTIEIDRHDNALNKREDNRNLLSAWKTVIHTKKGNRWEIKWTKTPITTKNNAIQIINNNVIKNKNDTNIDKVNNNIIKYNLIKENVRTYVIKSVLKTIKEGIKL